MNHLDDFIGSKVGVAILAAGLGKRMHSEIPKVLHLLSGKPIIFHVLKRVQQTLPNSPICVVIGHGKEAVEAYIRGELDFKSLKVTFVTQSEQRGTGHAAQCVVNSDWGKSCVSKKLPILLLPGDLPLISAELVAKMSEPLEKSYALRLLTCVMPDPTGYGRVVPQGKKNINFRIIEEKDASLKEKQLQEVAVSIYFFDSVYLKESLQNLSNENAQLEYYLTDVVGFAQIFKKKVSTLEWKVFGEVRGINDLWELAEAEQWMNEVSIKKWSRLGVKFLHPGSTRVEEGVQLAQGVIIHPGAILAGQTRIGEGAILGPRVVLNDVEVGEHSHIKTGTVAEQAKIGNHSQIGPYAHLRPGSVIGAEVKIGNFVELKKSIIGNRTSIAHLSYIGDAEIGSGVNIGCGFITCNFDGKKKHKTIIEDQVFLGSDCQTVAPVKVGKGAYVASGSTITEDVPAGSLAIARSRQVNKLGYGLKLRQDLGL